MDTKIEVEVRKVATWNLATDRHGLRKFFDPRSAAEAELEEWMWSKANKGEETRAGYFLREGTDEFKAKVRRLRDWLREEEIKLGMGCETVGEQE